MGMLPTVGRLFNSKQHKNCTDINEGEMVCCDAISQSDYALPNAVDVLFWNSETGKYDE